MGLIDGAMKSVVQVKITIHHMIPYGLHYVFQCVQTNAARLAFCISSYIISSLFIYLCQLTLLLCFSEFTLSSLSLFFPGFIFYFTILFVIFRNHYTWSNTTFNAFSSFPSFFKLFFLFFLLPFVCYNFASIFLNWPSSPILFLSLSLLLHSPSFHCFNLVQSLNIF